MREGSQHTPSYAFAAQRPSDALALGRRHVPISLATCEGGRAAAAVARCLGATLLALEDREPTRRAWSNKDLASVVGLLPTPHSGCPLLSYATDPDVEAAARRHGYSIAGPDGDLKQMLDRKQVARQLFIDAGLATVPWLAGTSTTLDFRALTDRIGSPFVLQADRGSAGRGSHFVRGESDFHAICEEVRDDHVSLVASPFLPGVTLNTHGVVTHDALTAGHASIQVTGVDDLTDLDFGYCGNDFGAARSLSSALLDRAREVTLTVAAALQALGWIGVFGLDLLLTRDELLPLEINPRFQGSSWLLAEVQQALGERPVGELHLEAALGEQPALGELHRPRLTEPSGAFLILHQQREPAALSDTPMTGIYQVDGSRLTFTRAGIGLLDCARDEIYIEGFPAAGHIIEPGAVLARLASWHRLVELDGGTLTATGSTLVDHLRALAQTEPTSFGVTPRPYPKGHASEAALTPSERSFAMAKNPENLEAPNKSEVKPVAKPDTVRQLGSLAIRGTQGGK